MKILKYGILALLLLAPSALFAQQKYALVIGNAAYTSVTKLNNTTNDARDMKTALETLGFNVESLLDAGRVQIEEAVERFKNRLRASKTSYGFFFYSGHGVQSGGENYLIPVDADIRTEAYLRDRAVSVQAVLDELNAAGNALNIVVLDACRDNPFSWNRSGSRGLIVVRSQPADSIIVYATSAGSTAADTSASGLGRNGLFTGHLLKHLKTSGLEVNEVFRLTGGDVARASGGGQRPAVYNQFYGVAYLGAKPDAQTPARPAPAVRAENLSGTRWTLNYYDFTKGETSSTIEFLAGGVFTDSDPDDKTRGNDVWEQNGATVLLHFNNHFVTFRGVFVTNDRIEGTIGTDTTAFTLTRIKDNAGKAYKPGDTGPAGGGIFYDKGSYTDGWRYLEAAPRDAGAVPWGLYGKSTAGTGTAVGSGKRNTQLILEALRRTGETGMAAQLCAAFEAGGFKDWFLPSKDELDLMYKNLKLKALGSFTQSWYWSSSEDDDDYLAWGQVFSDGRQGNVYRHLTASVRAVRAF